MVASSLRVATWIRRIARTRRCALLAVALLVACGSAEDADPDDGSRDDRPPFNETTLPADSTAPTTQLGGTRQTRRPPTRIDSVSIEGVTEPISLRLVESPNGFSPAFSVYVPEDFDAEFDADSGAEPDERGGVTLRRPAPSRTSRSSR